MLDEQEVYVDKGIQHVTKLRNHTTQGFFEFREVSASVGLSIMRNFIGAPLNWYFLTGANKLMS